MTVDSHRLLDLASRQIIRGWISREAGDTRSIPWAPMAKPLAGRPVALLTTDRAACLNNGPFGQQSERRNPWWGGPTWRRIPLGMSEGEVGLDHLHVDTRFGKQDRDVVMPTRRLAELAAEERVDRPAATLCSIMGYQLRSKLLRVPLQWPERPARARKGSNVQAPIASLLAREPWRLPKQFRGEILDEVCPL